MESERTSFRCPIVTRTAWTSPRVLGRRERLTEEKTTSLQRESPFTAARQVGRDHVPSRPCHNTQRLPTPSRFWKVQREGADRTSRTMSVTVQGVAFLTRIVSVTPKTVSVCHRGPPVSVCHRGPVGPTEYLSPVCRHGPARDCHHKRTGEYLSPTGCANRLSASQFNASLKIPHNCRNAAERIGAVCYGNNGNNNAPSHSERRRVPVTRQPIHGHQPARQVGRDHVPSRPCHNTQRLPTPSRSAGSSELGSTGSWQCLSPTSHRFASSKASQKNSQFAATQQSK